MTPSMLILGTRVCHTAITAYTSQTLIDPDHIPMIYQVAVLKCIDQNRNSQIHPMTFGNMTYPTLDIKCILIFMLRSKFEIIH